MAFNLLKYTVLDYDNGFTGATLPFKGDTLPIAIVSTAPTGTPAGNVGVVIQVVAGTITIWVWDGAAWRSK